MSVHKSKRFLQLVQTKLFKSEEKNQPESLKATLKDLAESSSLHGVPKIVSSRQLAVKLLWGLLWLSTFGVLALQIYSLFVLFYSNPIQTSVSLEFNAIPYPAITVCNMNPIRKSKLSMSPKLNAIVGVKTKSGQNRKKREATFNDIPERPINPFHEFSQDISEHPINPDQPMNSFYPIYSNQPIHSSTLSPLLSTRELETLKPSTVYDEEGPIRQPSIAASISSSVIDESEDFLANRNDRGEKISPTSTVQEAEVAKHLKAEDKINNRIHGRKNENDHMIVRQKREAGSISLSDISSLESSGVYISSSTYLSDSLSVESTGVYPSSGTYLSDSLSVESSSLVTDSYASSDYNYDYWGLDSGDSSSSSYDDPYYNAQYGDYGNNYYNQDAYLWDQLHATRDLWDERVDSFTTNIKKENISSRMEMGHRVEDMIQAASYAGIVQNVSKFFPSLTPHYGTCYTMNSPKYIAWRSGPSHGIKLTLNLEIDEYINNFASGYGIRVVLHEPGTFPLPADEGFTLSPGAETDIALKMVRVSRLAEPYGKCSNGESFQKKYEIKYSAAACMQFCRVQNIIENCGCLPADAPDNSMLNENSAPICDSSNVTEKTCVIKEDVYFNTGGNEACDCVSPCREAIYVKTLSGRRWPNEDYLENFLMADICKKNLTSMATACATVTNNTFNEVKYRYNFLRMLVYFEDLNYEFIEQEPLYSGIRFVSDIGGLMGLFMGASVLSFVEILQLVLEICLYLNRRAKNSNQIKKPKPDRKLSVFPQPIKIGSFKNVKDTIQISDPHCVASV